MVDTFSKQIKRVEDSLLGAAKGGFNKAVNRKLNNVVKQLEILQQEFFTVMAMKTVGVTGAPKLGEFTPAWKPLTDNYTEYREFTQDVPENQFFLFSGKLLTALNGMKATTYFGRPLVTYKRGSFEKKIDQNYLFPGRNRFKNEPLKAIIQIDLYPKVRDSIYDVDEGDLFSKKKITEIRNGKSYTTPIAYRLKNFQGSRDRPIVANFMNWWLQTKARAVIRKTVNK